jgi:hypothetical protein
MERSKRFTPWSILSLVAGIKADDFDFSNSSRDRHIAYHLPKTRKNPVPIRPPGERLRVVWTEPDDPQVIAALEEYASAVNVWNTPERETKEFGTGRDATPSRGRRRRSPRFQSVRNSPDCRPGAGSGGSSLMNRQGEPRREAK